MDEKLKDIAIIYKSFCDENRLVILELLKRHELCACELLEKLQISQSTLSYHMKILTEAKVVIGRRDRKWMFYSLNQERIIEAQRMLTKYITDNEVNIQVDMPNSCL